MHFLMKCHKCVMTFLQQESASTFSEITPINLILHEQ